MNVTTVKAETLIPGCRDALGVWGTVCGIQHYPEFMENVTEVKLIERSPTQGVSEWHVMVDGAPLAWVEKDFFDLKNFSYRFEALDGDLDLLQGYWRVELPQDGLGVRVLVSLDYSLGIPVIEEVLGDVLKEKMEANLKAMLAGIQAKYTSARQQRRRRRRIALGMRGKLKLNNMVTHAYIHDVSSLGMCLELDAAVAPVAGSLQFGEYSADIGSCFREPDGKRTRLVFKEELDRGHLFKIIRWIQQHAPVSAGGENPG